MAQNYALGLAAAGQISAVLAHAGAGPRLEYITKAGIPAFTATTPTDRDSAIQAAVEWKPDIVHVHRSGYPNTAETTLLKALRSSGPKIVETNVFARFDWTAANELIDVHLLLNNWCYYKWLAWGGTKARRKTSFVVPNAVDATAIKPVESERRIRLRSQLGIPGDRFIFGRVGQPILAKWSPATLEAFSTLVQREQTDAGLLLVGCPPELEQAVTRRPTKTREQIVLVPPTRSDERLAEYFSAMDAFIHTAAIGESFGMVLCEAMLVGLPIVTLSTPLKDNGQLEVVGHEHGGLVVLSKSALPEAMRRLVDDSELRSTIAGNTREWVLQRFDVAAIVQRLVEVYRHTLTGDPVADNLPRPDGRWISSIASRGIGDGPSLPQKGMFWLLHRPLVYRAYLGLRGRLRRA
ncbi:glycosyltransferase family 4 protein [Devosia sp.]|uniref:glycosyltransferase family 4 protein n=1 Tax=Devosia sp. TaxID=1871048 RepID=UPI001AC341EF|nr:glycosyltransferase family 4 protein [Devosia sp.]MBN9310466.1 glycosyltransferase family 4 protein [Devosia sp.]